MFKEGRISREKVLTRGQLQVKPFYNQPAEQARLRPGRNKWEKGGGGEAGRPGCSASGGAGGDGEMGRSAP